jgi:type II secretory pathway pseudopilin PulG
MPTTSATGSPAEAGFTLIEQLAVLAITAAIGALVFPSFERTLDSAALVQSTASLQASLKAARARAMGLGAAQQLVVAAGGEGWSWGGVLFTRPTGPVRLQLAGGGPIAFYRDGSASGGALVLTTGRGSAEVDVTSAGVVYARQAPRS